MSGPGRSRQFLVVWAIVWLSALSAQLTLGFVADATYVAPLLVFWIVVIGAGGCSVVSMIVIVRAFRQGVAETALLGSFLLAVSILPLVHGLLIPGVLVGDNDAVVLSTQLAIPVGAIAIAPLLRSDGRLVEWRRFVVAHIALVSAVAGLLLVRPDLLPAAATGSLPAVGFAAIAVVICAALSVRQMRLALIAQRWPAVAIACGLALIGTAPMIFVAGSLFGAAFWMAHAVDITGVFLAGITAIFAHRQGLTARALLAPIEATTPLRALEVGLDPLIHRLVADLDRKDPITRDHVVRTARLAVLVAREMRLGPMQVRNVGIGAILHDVGKLAIPDEILGKPDRLTDAELTVMKHHTILGHDMVLVSPALHDAAPFVRGHHERIDGRGYPDRLAGDEIPLGARIVAACDGWDAMSHSRQYREGMDRDRVIAIMREHQGSQWDPVVVDALLRVVGRADFEPTGPELSGVGRGGDHEPAALACCIEALPV